MRHTAAHPRRMAVALALVVGALVGPLTPAAHAKGTKAQCDAVQVITSVNPDPAKGGKNVKGELARLKAAEGKIPATLKGDAKKVRAFWEALVTWTSKYSDPMKAMSNPKGLADYAKLMEKVTTDVSPAVLHLTGWAMKECV